MSTPGAASSQNPLVPPGFGGVPLPAGIPSTVQRAFLILVGMIALNILATLVQSFGDFGSAGGVVGAVVGGAIGVYLALQFRGGRNWARIVLTVLLGLAMLGSLIGLIASFVLIAFAPLTALISIIVSAIVIVGGALTLVLAWNQESSAFFARMSV